MLRVINCIHDDSIDFERRYRPDAKHINLGV